MEYRRSKIDKIIMTVSVVLFVFIIFNLLIRHVLYMRDDSYTLSYNFWLLIPFLIIYISLLILYFKNKIDKFILIVYFIISIVLPVCRVEHKIYEQKVWQELYEDKAILTNIEEKVVDTYGITIMKKNVIVRGGNGTDG